jgi:hypothetical protein
MRHRMLVVAKCHVAKVTWVGPRCGPDGRRVLLASDGRPDRATVGHADRPAAGHAGRPLPPVGGVALSASGEVVASGKAKLTWAHWVSPTAPVVTVRKACLN